MKKCAYSGCNKPVFSHNYCRYHQDHREDDKWLNRPRIIINTYVEKKVKHQKSAIQMISAKKALEKKERHEKDIEFYLSLWKTRPHYCHHCLRALGDEPLMNYFHHILPKGQRQFKHLRYEPNNIIIVCQDHHDEAHYANPPQWFKDLWIRTYKYFQSKELLP